VTCQNVVGCLVCKQVHIVTRRYKHTHTVCVCVCERERERVGVWVRACGWVGACRTFKGNINLLSLY